MSESPAFPSHWQRPDRQDDTQAMPGYGSYPPPQQSGYPGQGYQQGRDPYEMPPTPSYRREPDRFSAPRQPQTGPAWLMPLFLLLTGAIFLTSLVMLISAIHTGGRAWAALLFGVGVVAGAIGFSLAFTDWRQSQGRS